MPTITRGTSANIDIPSGSTLRTFGEGTVTSYGINQTRPISLASAIGPFQFPQTVTVTANSDVDYQIVEARSLIPAASPGLSPSMNSSNSFTGLQGIGLGVAASRPTILAADFGASFNELCDQFGLDFATPVNITGVAPCRASMLTSNGNAFLEFEVVSPGVYRMRVTLPGETVGPWVAVADGIFQLPSGSTSNYMRVSVTSRLLPASNKSDIVASGTRYWRRPNGSWKYQISAAMFEQFTWLPTFGIGGNQSTDIAKRMGQILNSGAQIFFMNASGNDAVTGGMTVAQSVAQTMANADLCLKTGTPVVLQLLPPRYGKDAAGGALPFTGEYTAARQGNLTSGNRGYRSGAYSRPGMYVADPSAAIDPLSSQGAISNGYTADGKHPAGGLAHAIMLCNLLAITPLFNGYKFAPNVGAGDYFNASLNPGGNLLASNQGAFAGAGGTFNAGSSFPAWVTGTVVATGASVMNAGNLYTAVAGGTTGATAPTHTQGAASDGNVSWQYISKVIGPTPAWVTAALVLPRAYVINGGKLYCTDTGGTTGATAPSHTQGTVSDGGVPWTFICSGVVAGLGDGYAATIEGTGVTVSMHSVTDQTGARYQEVIVRGGPADGNGLRISASAFSGSNIAVGEIVTYEVDVSKIFNPGDCYGLFSDCILTGGLAVIWDNNSMQSIQQGMQIDACRISLEPMEFPAGVTNIQPRFHIQVKANGVLRIRLNNATFRKILP